MLCKKYGYYCLSYSLILLALFVSAYLLFHYYSLATGKAPGTDLCSVVFGKGCVSAALSKFSVFLKIPVGGWGVIYLVLLLCFIAFSQYFAADETDEFIQIAFWISFAGILFSMFYIGLMIAVPALFCPFCTIFHVLNFILFFVVKKLSNKPFSVLISGLTKAFGIVFLARPVAYEYNKLRWIAIIFPFVAGLVLYQWALMQEQNIRINSLSAYNPLEEIEKFETREVFDINVSPDDPLMGPVDAPVTLVVFSDFQCSLCKMFASNFKYLIEYNKEKLNIRFKYFPLSTKCNSLVQNDMHPLACEAARAAEAARLQRRFWEYHDSVFSMETLKDEEQLFHIARMLDLDMGKFEADYHSESIRFKINQDVQEGVRLNLDGTPTAFLNGRKLEKLSENNINLLIKLLSN